MLRFSRAVCFLTVLVAIPNERAGPVGVHWGNASSPSRFCRIGVISAITAFSGADGTEVEPGHKSGECTARYASDARHSQNDKYSESRGVTQLRPSKGADRERPPL